MLLSSEKKPLRITIHPTMINKNVVGSSTTIIDYNTIKKSSYKTIGDLISKYSGINFDNFIMGLMQKLLLELEALVSKHLVIYLS